MTPEKARIIVRHHLGSVPHLIKRAGPHADDREVVALSSDGMIHIIAPTPEEAARKAADQLRAAGWTPTHARLEWERDGDDFRLWLRMDRWAHIAVYGKVFTTGFGWAMVEGDDISEYPSTAAEVLAAVTAWHAAHLPSLHLPPFPETPHAS